MDFIRGGCFLGAGREPARIALFGVPLDQTTSFRPGTRFAPGKVREVSENLEEYSPMLDRELGEASFADLGDVDLVPGQLEVNLERIERVGATLARQGQIPLAIGGEHLISYPLVKGLLETHPDLLFIQLDAHADLRADYLGQPLSHASVVRRVVELLGGERVYQLGIRSGTRDEFAYGCRETRFFPGEVLAPLGELVQGFGDRPIYLSIDIDVVDPAFAPGTGTPEPGGITSGELLEGLYLLQGINLVGMDIVELCPPADSGDITAMLVAKLIRETCLIWG
ncbi:MAG: agmatinase [Limnochordia bacterium]